MRSSGPQAKPLHTQLDSLGILDENTIAVHCVWVDEVDIEILASKKVFVTHAPESNMKLGSGIAPIYSMIEKGIRGSIINMASMSGSIVNVPQWQCSYNASKAAVIHMTRSLAAEWAEYGIRVNSLSPGYIGTPMSVDTPQELKDAWMPLIPMHRMGNPEELIPPVLYLACDASGYTTGSDVIVDGAYSCL